MEAAGNFGAWLKRRRREVDLTQQQLADCAACSVVTIRKFEAGERRPSRELARLLSGCLDIPAADLESFIAFARGLQPQFDHPTSRNAIPASMPAPQERPVMLPIPPTPFVGRTAELEQIAVRLADPACRLLTLVGPGGIGKTRLALAAAGAAAKQFAGGAVFVSLSGIRDAATLPQSIAHALNVTLSGSAEPAVQLGHYLQDRRLLLVLDNFESVLDGAELLAGWLQQAPHVKWLVTSRERLSLVEEWLLPLHGLATAEAGMALFAQVAGRIRPDFSLTEQAAAVSEICSLVGGMPLAIELAAGWAATLSAEQILQQIQGVFDFLSTSLRNVPQRHRSLRRLYDQSWELLVPGEQQLLMKLSVFQGGFAPDEAAQVAGATGHLLRKLADKALVLPSGSNRYQLHELTRQYAAGKLQESGEEKVMRRQHGYTFLALAEEFDRQRSGPEGIAWYERMETERANLNAALGWLIGEGRAADSLRLANALWWFWFRRGYWREAGRWLETLLVGESDDPQYCLALLYHSTIIALQGRYVEAAPYLMQALTMARRLDHQVVLAGALTVLGQALPGADEALAAFLEARAILEQEQGERPAMMLALLDNLIGERLQKSGRHDEAAAYYQQSLDLYRSRGNVDLIAYPLGNLGMLALQEGRFDEAQARISEALALSQASGNRQGTADWLIPLARLYLIEGEQGTAAACYQEALVLHREMGNAHGQAEAMMGLALVALEARDPQSAKRHIDRTLETYAAIYHHTRQADAALSSGAESLTPDFVDCLYVAGLVATAIDDDDQAAKFFISAERLGQQLQHEPAAPLAAWIAREPAAVRRRLGASAYDRIRATTSGDSLAAIFHFAVEATKRPFERLLEGSGRDGP